MASSAACQYGAEEQTVDHVVLQCPVHPHGLYGLTVLAGADPSSKFRGGGDFSIISQSSLITGSLL